MMNKQEFERYLIDNRGILSKLNHSTMVEPDVEHSSHKYYLCLNGLHYATINDNGLKSVTLNPLIGDIIDYTEIRIQLEAEIIKAKDDFIKQFLL